MEEKRYPRNYFSSLGISIGVPVGVALGLIFGNLGIGVTVGLSAGVIVGRLLEKKKNPNPLDQDSEEHAKGRKRLLLMFLIGDAVFLALAAYIVLSR